MQGGGKTNVSIVVVIIIELQFFIFKPQLFVFELQLFII
jgi:hypothetical protein